MDFTRDPIVESVITPKEGFKLVVRSSKASSQEEFFVDAVELVSFGGNTFFLRSLERPKSFFVPATDYEVLEVRETRMVLKTVGMDRTIKIGGGKAQKKKEKPKREEKVEEPDADKEEIKKARLEKRREKRRQGRKKRPEKEEVVETAETKDVEAPPKPSKLLPPPAKLISETILRYKEDESFQGVFTPEGEDVPAIDPTEKHQESEKLDPEPVEEPEVHYEDPLFSESDKESP